MNKRILGAMILATALFSSPVLAAKNTGNTSQKGSLLIFPAIDVNPEDNSDTLIESKLVSLALWPASNAGGARARVGHPTGSREPACLLISGRALNSASATLAIART